MKTILAAVLLAVTGCATVDHERYPLPEEMPAGRVMCRALCASYARNFCEYRYDGKCVCMDSYGKCPPPSSAPDEQL